MHRWIVRNVLFRLQERAKGHPTLRILKEMERAERLDAVSFEELQSGKLRDLITYVVKHVPHIRETLRRAGLSASDIQSASDLSRLPVMRKADVRANRTGLRSVAAGKLTPSATGGSTGEPLLFDLPKERIASWIACRQRVMQWWNLSVGNKEFAIWGSPVELTRQDHLRSVRDRLFRTRLLSAFDMSDSAMSRYLDVLTRNGCDTIFSYPSSMYLLCQHARKRNIDLRRLGVKAVFVTGEVLLPRHRAVISETLNCAVANGYGGRESGFIAHECPHGGMHIMADATLVEILGPDGRAVPDGEPGEIIVTDLYSREAPFIRYATGDIGVLSRDRCRCGRPLPLLEHIEGRRTDFVLAPDGAALHALSVIYILREIEGISEFTVHQEALDRFHIQVVRNDSYSSDSEARICQALQQRMRCRLHITIEYPRRLACGPSGKFRYVTSNIALDADSCQC